MEIKIGYVEGGNDSFKNINDLVSFLNSISNTPDYIKFSDLKEKDVKMLAPVFSHPKINNLNDLRFIYNPDIGDKGVKELAPMLAKLTKLKSLDFNNCGLGKKGIEALTPALEKLTNLEDFAFKYNANIGFKEQRILFDKLPWVERFEGPNLVCDIRKCDITNLPGIREFRDLNLCYRTRNTTESPVTTAISPMATDTPKFTTTPAMTNHSITDDNSGTFALGAVLGVFITCMLACLARQILKAFNYDVGTYKKVNREEAPTELDNVAASAHAFLHSNRAV